jgi:hypothetical protein
MHQAASRPMRSNAARPPRDKPDYHVHIRPQTETSAGPQNCREVSPRGNTQVGRSALAPYICLSSSNLEHEELDFDDRFGQGP